MSAITIENRNRSFRELNSNGKASTRRKMVLANLREFPFGVGAKELAVSMFQKGLIETDDRNQVHPRLNELVSYGQVKVCGKRKCPFTHKLVSIYQVVKPKFENANVEEKEAAVAA